MYEIHFETSFWEQNFHNRLSKTYNILANEFSITNFLKYMKYVLDRVFFCSILLLLLQRWAVMTVVTAVVMGCNEGKTDRIIRSYRSTVDVQVQKKRGVGSNCQHLCVNSFAGSIFNSKISTVKD